MGNIQQNIKLARILRKQQTDAERILWKYLRGNALGVKFCRQVPIGRFIANFICYKNNLIIEIDGGQHNDGKVKTYDEIRTNFFNNQGYTVVRFWNSDITANFDGVLTKIEQVLNSM